MTAGCVAAAASILSRAYIVDPVMLFWPAASGAAASACALLALHRTPLIHTQNTLAALVLALNSKVSCCHHDDLMDSPKSGRKLAVALQGCQSSHGRFCWRWCTGHAVSLQGIGGVQQGISSSTCRCEHALLLSCIIT